MDNRRSTSPISIVGDYFAALAERFGQGWNRFWFAPSDPLALSAVRVLAGAVAFYSLLTFTPDLEALLGSNGVLQMADLARVRGELGEYTFSFLYVLQEPNQLLAFHVAALCVTGLFMLGLWTRVTSILTFLIFLSYFQRAVVVSSQMEPVLIFVLFYLCLGPSGACLSLDRRIRLRRAAAAGDPAPAHAAPSWTATVASRLIQVHLVAVYVMMLLAQLNTNNWWDGTAIWWLAGRPDSALVDLTWMYRYPRMVNAWTHAFVLYEAAFVVLAWNRLTAPLIVALGVVAWGLMALVTGLVPLAVVMVAGSLAFVPPESLRTLFGSFARPAAA